jgi:hypothetical protein
MVVSHDQLMHQDSEWFFRQPRDIAIVTIPLCTRRSSQSSSPRSERPAQGGLSPEFLAFCRYIRSLHPPDVRLHRVLDNFSPHLGQPIGD